MAAGKGARRGGGRDYGELERRVAAFRDARDWRRFHNPKDLAISIALEAAELLEHFQWQSVGRTQARPTTRHHPPRHSA